MDLFRVQQLEFPDPTEELQDNDELRAAYLKGNAYVTLALESAEFPHSRSEPAAAVTDATYTLKERDDPRDYLDLAQQEVAFVANNATIEWFARDMEFVRQTIASAY